MKEVEEDEGHLVDDEEGPDDSTSQEPWHIHSQPGPGIEWYFFLYKPWICQNLVSYFSPYRFAIFLAVQTAAALSFGESVTFTDSLTHWLSVTFEKHKYRAILDIFEKQLQFLHFPYVRGIILCY